MSNIIRIKRGITGGVVPTGLTFGELAVNITDKKIFVGGQTGNTIELSGGGSAVTVKSAPGSLQYADNSATDLAADGYLKYNYSSDYSFEAPANLKVGTQFGGYLVFDDGTTQGTAFKGMASVNIPLATTGSTGVASFDDAYFQLGSTGHVSIKTGIKAGNIVVLGYSPIFGAGATGALPALDGSQLLEVNAKYLSGKTLNQVTDGGTF